MSCSCEHSCGCHNSGYGGLSDNDRYVIEQGRLAREDYDRRLRRAIVGDDPPPPRRSSGAYGFHSPGFGPWILGR